MFTVSLVFNVRQAERSCLEDGLRELDAKHKVTQQDDPDIADM